MAKYRFSTVIMVLVLSGCQSVDHSQNWHTSPQRWTQSRVYHSEFGNEFKDNIVLQKGEFPTQGLVSVVSPNRAYRYFVHQPDYLKAGPWSTSLYIDNETEALFIIKIKDHNNWGIEANWINEKLLYVSVWWGRIVGSYFIVDVEKEEIIQSEMIHDGTIVYQQYQQGRRSVK